MAIKKILPSLFLIFAAGYAASAQDIWDKGQKQVNAGFGFSNWGTPVYVGLDFGMNSNITIGPRVSYRNYGYRFAGSSFNQSLIVISFNGNYHFDSLLELPSEWNLYAGLSMGYYLWSSPGDGIGGARSSGVGLDAQIGGRYWISDNFGINLELGGGMGTGGLLGITYRF